MYRVEHIELYPPTIGRGKGKTVISHGEKIVLPARRKDEGGAATERDNTDISETDVQYTFWHIPGSALEDVSPDWKLVAQGREMEIIRTPRYYPPGATRERVRLYARYRANRGVR